MLRNEEGRLDYEDVKMECHQQKKAPEECPVEFLVRCAEGRQLESSSGNLLSHSSPELANSCDRVSCVVPPPPKYTRKWMRNSLEALSIWGVN